MSARGPRVVWTPSEEDHARANVTAFLSWVQSRHGVDFADWEALRRWSIDEQGPFWEAVWEFYDVRASVPYETVLASAAMPGARWFEGARLNYAENVLAGATDEQPAILAVAEGERPVAVSWATVRGQVGALAATLRELGVQRGDRVAAYLPNIPEAVVGLLATASLGAVWTACGPDFGARSVIDRLGQARPTVLLAVDGYRHNGKAHDRRDVVAELQAAMPSLRGTVLVRSLAPDEPPPAALGALAFDDVVRDPREPTFEQVPAGHPLWILFSSGTTGLPKGLVHSHGGILLEHLKSLGLCLDLRPDDRYFFMSSTSWMAWNYLVGGLLHGATIIQYNGSATHPEVDGLWRVASEVQATILGMGSAYAAGCQKAGVELRDNGLGGLRTVIPTGSPLAPAGWDWLIEQLDPRVRIDSILGGTDVCSVFFGGSPILPVFHGEISARWLGVAAEAHDDDGRALIDHVGEFVLTRPMPSMPTGLLDDHDGQRYREAYFDVEPGVWRQGDWITITARGTVIPGGRSDATLNRAGVRLGSAEIYAVVEALPQVLDSLVVGVELPDGGYFMPLFVVLAPGVDDDDELRAAIATALRTQLSPRHVPDEVLAVAAVPRTLTGKKLEVPIKRILQGVPADQAVSVGAIDAPDAVAWFADFARERLRPDPS